LFEEFVDGFKVTVFRKALRETEQEKNPGQKHGQIDQEGDQDVIVQIVEFCKEPKSANKIMQRLRRLQRSKIHYLTGSRRFYCMT
jgi:hypothetical protein